MKFNEEKKPGLMGLTIVLTEIKAVQDPEIEPFQIQADKMGIRFSGKSNYLESGDLQDLAKAIDRAWRAHLVAKPKILNERGH